MSASRPTKQESIHPRAYRGDGVKKNTCASKNKGVTARKIAALEKHLEVHPTDRHSQSHVQALRGAL